MKVTHEQFQQKPLRVHMFLSGVPLTDVWAFRLQGGGPGRTLEDFRALWSLAQMEQVNLITKGLFKLRAMLGHLFGWDDVQTTAARLEKDSFVQYLTETDWRRSLKEPGGATMGPFRRVYAFANETLDEVINGTAHAFSAMAFEATTEGYIVYWAIYVRKINWLTPIYMALINPFRRILVYPPIIQLVERQWISAFN